MRCRPSRGLAVAGVLLSAGATATARGQGPTPSPAATTYAERYRPQYHFAPAAHWMNDPNGMVYADGAWHLFYQYNPFGITWGHMSWGHAVSRDLVHWQQLPVAIPEANGEMVFSGSAVVDARNTSGFGRGGVPPMVAIYTAVRGTSQAQALASSTDRGRTWTRYAGNPVLDIGSREFRDPKVFWYAPQQKWVMVVSLATLHTIRLYASPDLKRWTPLSEFGPAAAVGGVWECPDLFELPIDGDATHTRWVLVVNVNPGGIAGGSGTQYFVGDFDGTRFTPDETTPPTADPTVAGVRWADYGSDLYATVSWAGVPAADGRRVWLGWMNNWAYAGDIPTAPWRSAQSIPRTVTLTRTPAGIQLVQQPVAELAVLRGTRRSLGAQPVVTGSTSLAAQGISGKALEIAATFEVDTTAPGTAREFGVKVRTGVGEETLVGIDLRAGQLFVDRTRSGQTGFHRGFSGRQTAPLPVEYAGGRAARVRLRLFVDWSSIEVFGGDGRVVITDQIFPAPESDGVSLYATGGVAHLVSLDAWPLASAWSTVAPTTRTGR